MYESIPLEPTFDRSSSKVAAPAVHAAPLQATRRKIKTLEAMVADVIQETPDSATIVLFTGNEHLEYKPGHFLTIDPHQFLSLERFTAFLEDQKGKRESPRAYSLASAPHERHIAFTVKEERYVKGMTKYPPLLSPLLVRQLARGTPMQITGFTGPYTLHDDIEERAADVLHLCAGSGIVPNFSMIKSSLATGRKVRHTLVYSNKAHDEIIFARELDALQRQYPERLRVLHTLTRETNDALFGPSVVKGRVTRPLIQSALRDIRGDYVYLCGPAISPWDRKAAAEKGIEAAPRFLETALACLTEIGVPNGHVFYESYG